MVPVPSAESFAELNAKLEADCRQDLERIIAGETDTKAQRLERERAALLPLPEVRFEAARIEQRTVNSLALVRFDRNDYSVPTRCAHQPVTAVASVQQVRILAGTEVVAEHPRDWGRRRTHFDPRHYLALLERKPGALDHARPLQGWVLPECFEVLRRRLEDEFESEGKREYIRVLDRLRPAAFVMENVKGMLSSTVESRLVFEMLMDDLASLGTGSGHHYELRAIRTTNGTACLRQAVQPSAIGLCWCLASNSAELFRCCSCSAVSSLRKK